VIAYILVWRSTRANETRKASKIRKSIIICLSNTGRHRSLGQIEFGDMLELLTCSNPLIV